MEILINLGLVILGFFIGVVDVVAGGGNLITVSILGLTSLSAINAIATMQIITLIQTTTASLAFAKEKLINWKQALIFAPFAVVGSFLGAQVAININRTLLSYLVGGLMILLLFVIPQIKEEEISFNRIVGRLFRKLTDQRPVITHSHLRIAILMLISLILGFYGGFYGGSVGTLLLITFYFVGQAGIMATAATTKVIDVIMSIIASYVYFTQPDLVVWQYAFPMIVGAIIGSFVGVKWAKKLGYKYIRIIMYLVVIAAAIKFIFFAQ
jgi:hypothetical protein